MLLPWLTQRDCAYSLPLHGGWKTSHHQIDAACEGDWSIDKCLEAGERIWNMERQYNNAAGFTAADDTLPKRLLKEEIKSGPTEGQVNKLGEMLPVYYEVRGWTPQGVPTAETLSRLGLS